MEEEERIGKRGRDRSELAMKVQREKEREREMNRGGGVLMNGGGLSLSPTRWPITVGARSDAPQVERTLFFSSGPQNIPPSFHPSIPPFASREKSRPNFGAAFVGFTVQLLHAVP